MRVPFVFGPAERAALEALRQRAGLAPVDMARLMAGPGLKDPARKRRHLRQMTEQSVLLPFGYLVTYSVELNHPSGAAARHMSMSHPDPARAPNEFAVWTVCEALGFTGLTRLDQARTDLRNLVGGVWLEDLDEGGTAVNVLQLITARAGRA